MRRFLAVLLAAGLLIAVSAFTATGAAAKTSPLTITADRASAIPAGHNWGFNDFFPRTISVHRGATIAFSIQGFHTATLLPAGMSPTTARMTMGIAKADPDDTTPNVNGSSHVTENLGGLVPMPGGCGSAAHPCPFNGSAPVSSGAPLGGPGAFPLFRVNVTAPVGFYRFACLIHPKMEGWLAVVPAEFHATTAAELAASVHAQILQDRRAGFVAEAAANHPRSHLNSDGTRTWTAAAGTSSPDGHVAINEMLPRTLAIHKGDNVIWVSRGVNEPHTITFPTDLHTEPAVLCEPVVGTTDTPATPKHIPPTGPQDFKCAAPTDVLEFESDGGNGVNHVTSKSTVSDSGLIASSQLIAGFGLPSTAASATWRISFAGASRTTYHFVCQIHFGMAGTIVVH
ncbi:MAG: hypothetical protein M3067_05725 [Chloroflexota bacterium]|nr:hypothetical protein [Chloroflexota bacterium]